MWRRGFDDTLEGEIFLEPFWDHPADVGILSIGIMGHLRMTLAREVERGWEINDSRCSAEDQHPLGVFARAKA